MTCSADFIKDGKVNFRTQPKGTKGITAKRKLERLQFSTSSSFVKI